MKPIPRYIYCPSRQAPAYISPETMELVRQLYNNPISRPRDVRPLSIIEGDGLDQNRKYFLNKYKK